MRIKTDVLILHFSSYLSLRMEIYRLHLSELKSISNSIYKIFNVRKNVRGSLLAFGLDSPFLLGTTSQLPGASSCYTLLHYILHITYHTLYIYHTLHITHITHYTATATTTASPTLGIEPGPPAWESSTLPNEPLDVRTIHLYFRYL